MPHLHVVTARTDEVMFPLTQVLICGDINTYSHRGKLEATHDIWERGNIREEKT